MPKIEENAPPPSSNVVSFPAVTSVSVRPQQLAAVRDAVNAVAATSAAVCSNLLLEGVGDLEQAVNKMAGIVAAMPEGEARRRAEIELKSIRSQLETAKALSREVAVAPDLGND